MKPKLLMLKGLPASGKSTYAKELVDKGWKRVNKDELRSMIDSSKWSKNNEMFIKYAEIDIAKRYLKEGFNVVVDDTNFAYEEMWGNVAKEFNAEFEVKFFDTPINECLKRDALRGDKGVGTEVIWRMYNKYLRHNIVKPEYNPDLPNAYISDMDGTLAIMKDRNPFAWDRVGEDACNENVARIIKDLHKLGNKIIIASGRDICSENETVAWLRKYDIPFDHIVMRPLGDKRGDQIVKKELYDNYIKDKYNVLGVFDDRDSVVALWRSLGLTCFQVDYGDF